MPAPGGSIQPLRGTAIRSTHLTGVSHPHFKTQPRLVTTGALWSNQKELQIYLHSLEDQYSLVPFSGHFCDCICLISGISMNHTAVLPPTHTMVGFSASDSRNNSPWLPTLN